MRIGIDPKALPHHGAERIGRNVANCKGFAAYIFLLSWFRGSGKNAVGFN
jgi:hypothetical protein